MFRKIAYSLLALASLCGCSSERAVKAPHSYSDYMNKLDVSKRNVFVYLTAEECGNCRVLQRKLKDFRSYPEWTIVPLELNAYGFPGELKNISDTERKDALRAVKDKFGVMLDFTGIPKVLVAVDGKTLGNGGARIDTDGKLWLSFFPDYAPGMNEVPISPQVFVGCLKDAAKVETEGGLADKIFSSETATACFEEGVNAGIQSAESGITSRRLYALDAAKECFGESDNAGIRSAKSGITGREIFRCVFDVSERGNNWVPMNWVFDDPENAVSCSRMNKEAADFTKMCGNMVKPKL